MAGGVFESGGDLVIKQFFGMSSAVPMNKHSGGVKNDRATEGLSPAMDRVRYMCLVGGLFGRSRVSSPSLTLIGAASAHPQRGSRSRICRSAPPPTYAQYALNATLQPNDHRVT